MFHNHTAKIRALFLFSKSFLLKSVIELLTVLKRFIACLIITFAKLLIKHSLAIVCLLTSVIKFLINSNIKLLTFINISSVVDLSRSHCKDTTDFSLVKTFSSL